MIELRHLSKSFRSADAEIRALDDICLRIPDGEIFGIIGLSGAGKSTLVRCINLLERPDSGQVLLDGRDLAAMSAAELRRARKSMSMIFQGFHLRMQRTALENVCFPLELAGVKKDAARRRAKELLELVELPDKAGAYPVQLSGGQKQRVAIARALASDPKVLLCDEATSALDPKTTRAILELLKKLNRERGISMLFISHNLNVVRKLCSRVAVMQRGLLVETGRTDDVFYHPQHTYTQHLIEAIPTRERRQS